MTTGEDLRRQLDEAKHQIRDLYRELEEANRGLIALLVESEQNFRSLIYNITDGILVVDKMGDVLFANPAASSLLGYTHKDLKGKIFDFPLLVGEEKELVLQRSDGSSINLEMRVAEAEWEGKNVYLASLRDITERKSMQEQLMLADRLASIGQLAAGVAHEINNPLAGVIGIARLLVKKNIPDWVREEVEIIDGEAQRAANVVRGLLTFARYSKETEMGPVSINSIIEGVLELRSYQQRVNNIEVITSLDPDLSYIVGNGAQIQQVLVNLIVNAEQAMLDANGKGRLKIKTEVCGDKAQVSIEDDGPGINSVNMKKLFTPFFTTKDVGKGTGIGLSICHGIVSKHGGRIYAESEPGEGANFIVELPVPAG